jgi:hypothetical protein
MDMVKFFSDYDRHRAVFGILSAMRPDLTVVWLPSTLSFMT